MPEVVQRVLGIGINNSADQAFAGPSACVQHRGCALHPVSERIASEGSVDPGAWCEPKCHGRGASPLHPAAPLPAKWIARAWHRRLSRVSSTPGAARPCDTTSAHMACTLGRASAILAIAASKLLRTALRRPNPPSAAVAREPELLSGNSNAATNSGAGKTVRVSGSVSRSLRPVGRPVQNVPEELLLACW